MVRQRSIRLLVLRLGLAYWPGIMLLSLQIRSVVMWNDLVTAFCCCDLVHVIQGSVSGQLSARSLPTMSEIDVNDALIFWFGRPLTPKSDQCLRGEEFFGGVDDSLEYRVQCVAPPHQPQRDRGIAGIINF